MGRETSKGASSVVLDEKRIADALLSHPEEVSE